MLSLFLFCDLHFKRKVQKLDLSWCNVFIYKGLIGELCLMEKKCNYRKKQKLISQNWKQETAFLLPWKTLELLVSGTCAIGILKLTFFIFMPLFLVFIALLLNDFFLLWISFFFSFWSFRFWPNNKSRMYLLENTGGLFEFCYWSIYIIVFMSNKIVLIFNHNLSGDFVRTNGLQEGDFIVIYSDIKCGKYVRTKPSYNSRTLFQILRIFSKFCWLSS